MTRIGAYVEEESTSCKNIIGKLEKRQLLEVRTLRE